MKHHINRFVASYCRAARGRSAGARVMTVIIGSAAMCFAPQAGASGDRMYAQPYSATGSIGGAGLQQLDLARDHALDGQVSIVIDGRWMTLTHWPQSVRGEAFRVLAQVDDGSMVELDAAAARTVRGVIEQLPGSMVSGSLLDDGLHAHVHLPDGRLLVVKPAAHPADGLGAGWHAVHDVTDEDRLNGWADVGDVVVAGAQGAALGYECRVAEIAIDADFDMYMLHGGVEAAVIDRIESIINAVNVQYENEVGITHEMTEIIIRTSPGQNPYTTNDAPTLLQQFRNTWNSEPEASIPRDVAHLFTGRNLNGNVVGLAMIGVVCDVANAYAVTRDMSIEFPCMTDLVARQLGLNWNASVCDCPGTTMHQLLSCANTFIGPGSNSVEEILAYADSVDCLEPCESHDCELLADLNCDGAVDGLDMLILLGTWGACVDPDDCPADINDDGVVDGLDLLILLSSWG